MRVDWSASTNDKFFGRYSFALYEDRRDQQPFPLVFATRNDQPFHNVGFNWNRVFGSSLINELLVGYSSTTVIVGDVRLGRRRRRQCAVRDRRRTTDRRPQLDRMGQRAHAAGSDRDRLGHARQDLSDQREGDLDQGPPRGQIRRAVPALQPAPFLRGKQRVARLHQLQRRPSRTSRSPTSCSTRCPARAGAAATRTTRGRTCRIGSRSLPRTTSRSCET